MASCPGGQIKKKKLAFQDENVPISVLHKKYTVIVKE